METARCLGLAACSRPSRGSVGLFGVLGEELDSLPIGQSQKNLSIQPMRMYKYKYMDSYFVPHPAHHNRTLPLGTWESEVPPVELSFPESEKTELETGEGWWQLPVAFFFF